MTLKDRRWGWYHIYSSTGRRLSSKPVRGTSDNQALGNFYRSNSKGWPEGVYAQRISSIHPRSQVTHMAAESVEAKQERAKQLEPEQLSFSL